MEYRKLISFGKSSFVVSLPKSWVVQNKMKKGDLVYMEDSGSNLLLSRKEAEQSLEEREKIINIDGKDLPLIEREVNGAYILNCRKIVLKGSEVKNRIKELQSVIHNLIALEIMEQTSDSIVAKDFLDMDKVSVHELIRKMDIVTRTMFSESSNIFNEDNYESVNERDKDVNRLYFLLYRSVQYNMENPLKAMRNLKLTALDLLAIHSVGFYIEGIADEVRRTARYARKLKPSAPTKKELEQFFHKLLNYYTDTLKAVYNKDVAASLKLSGLKKELNRELDQLDEKNKRFDQFSNMVSRLRRMISYIHNVGRLTYTIGNQGNHS